MKKKYSYKKIQVFDETRVNKINELGSEGWHVVGCYPFQNHLGTITFEILLEKESICEAEDCGGIVMD